MSSKIEEIIKTNFNKRLFDDVIADLALLFYVYNKHKKVLGILHGYKKRIPYRNIYMTDDETMPGHCVICCKKCDLNTDLCNTCDMTADTQSEY